MNVFVTDIDPRLSAIALDDRRVGKMAIESAQLICSQLIKRGVEAPYKRVRHPLVDWLDDNALAWLWEHYRYLLFEWKYRFGREHGASVVIKLVDHISPIVGTPEFYNNAKRRSLNLDYTDDPDVIRAYRAYMNERWRLSSPVWTKRSPPAWRI